MDVESINFMVSKLARMLGVCIVVVAAFSSIASALPADGAVHPEMIVSAKWLSEHLSDPKVIVLEVAASMGPQRASYDAGHIPGARLLLGEDFVQGRDA